MKSVNDIMPMIGARFYTQLDSAQVKSDVLEGELSKVLHPMKQLANAIDLILFFKK